MLTWGTGERKKAKEADLFSELHTIYCRRLMSERPRIFKHPVQVERSGGDREPWGNIEQKDTEA